MFHYWGWRGDRSNPPSAKFIATTVEDRSMDTIIAQVPLLQNRDASDHRNWSIPIMRHNYEKDRTPAELAQKRQREIERGTAH